MHKSFRKGDIIFIYLGINGLRRYQNKYFTQREDEPSKKILLYLINSYRDGEDGGLSRMSSTGTKEDDGKGYRNEVKVRDVDNNSERSRKDRDSNRYIESH